MWPHICPCVPQALAERLLSELRKSSDRFEVRLPMMEPVPI